MSEWNVSVIGKGESSTITVRHNRLATAFSMTQQEARDLVNDLSHVTLMPPRTRRPAGEVERCPECGHALSRHNELGYCSVTSRTKGDCMCGSVRTPITPASPSESP